MLIDGKFGGKVFSITEGYLDQLGVSKRTGEARDNGGTVNIANAVDENGHAWSGTVDAQTYYKHIGGKTPAGAAYIFDATAIRLRLEAAAEGERGERSPPRPDRQQPVLLQARSAV